MDPKWLRDLLALDALRSFSRAAEQRRITQSAFSRRIRALEDWAGIPLVQRDRVPLALSEEGERLMPLAREVVTRLDTLEAHVAELRQDQRHVLRLAAQHSPSTSDLPAHLKALHDRVPGLRTHVTSANLTDCIDLLKKGSCDIVVCLTHPSINLEIEEDLFETLHIGQDRLVPVCAATTSGQWSFPGTPENPMPLVTYEPNSFLGTVLATTLSDPRIVGEIRHVDSYSEALKKIVMGGFGAAWLPGSLVSHELEAGLLKPLADEAWQPQLHLVAILRRDAKGPAMRAARGLFNQLSDGIETC